MGTKGVYLQEEARLNACYGRGFEKRDEDCIECNLQGDCESLTKLRKERRRSIVAKKPKAKVRVTTYETEDEDVPWGSTSNEDEEEGSNDEEEVEQAIQHNWWPQYNWGPSPVNAQPQPTKSKKKQHLPPYHPYYYQPGYTYQPPPVPPMPPTIYPGMPMMPPMPMPHAMHGIPQMQLLPPGHHTTSTTLAHPTHSHLNYIIGMPVGCPMPYPGESGWVRLGKNVAARALSAIGFMVGEFFSEWMFPQRG